MCVCVWRCVCCCSQTEREVSSIDARSSFSEFDLFSERLTVTPGFCDRWIYRKIEQSPLFSKLPQILHLDASSQCAFSQRKVVSRFKKWNEQLCVLFMPDLQELHRTNEPKAEQIRATRLGYRPFICSDRRHGLLSITRHRYTQRWEIQWSSRIHRGINNISVKSCEKHSNSPQNYVKATDIEINSTDVETRRNIVQ